MYICVVNLLGTLVGVTHRVNGISPSGECQYTDVRLQRMKRNNLCQVDRLCSRATFENRLHRHGLFSCLPLAPFRPPRSISQSHCSWLVQFRSPRKSRGWLQVCRPRRPRAFPAGLGPAHRHRGMLRCCLRERRVRMERTKMS